MLFDDFLHMINDFGRYQKVRYIFICLTYMLPPSEYLSITNNENDLISNGLYLVIRCWQTIISM